MSETKQELCGSVSLEGQRCMLPLHHSTSRHHIGDDGSSWSEGAAVDGAMKRIKMLEASNADLLEALEGTAAMLDAVGMTHSEEAHRGEISMDNCMACDRRQVLATAHALIARLKGETG